MPRSVVRCTVCDKLDAVEAKLTVQTLLTEHYQELLLEVEERITAAVTEIETTTCVRLPKWWIKHMRSTLTGDAPC